MLSLTVLNFYFAKMIEKRNDKLGLWLSVFFSIGTLIIFKYFNFIYDNIIVVLNKINDENSVRTFNIALPIGISFYVFQTMSYTIDVYRKQVKASNNFINYATYVTMFPQLVAGPIVRYFDIEKQLLKRSFSWNQFYDGVERFIIGLSKKMILANTFAFLADNIFNQPVHDLSTVMTWLGVLAYGLQIYFDFSGYSDMAIGLGKMFGIDFLENFNFPYISKSIQEFWRRWHISLSTWFRDYLYIPLGGNKKGPFRTYVNLIIVFFITGLWHGASWNFIIFGLFHGTFMIIERLGFKSILEKIPKAFQHLYTIIILLIGWVFFRADSMTYAIEYINKLFSLSKGNESVNQYIYYLNFNIETYIVFILGIIFSTPIFNPESLWKKSYLKIKPVIMILLLILSIFHIAASAYNPFIYFKF
jgi:alginate O-acetyltransferase complex protein AlgI